MSNDASVIIGTERAEFVRITARRRTNPGSTDYWDGNWLDAALEVRAGRFHGSVTANLRTTDFGEFRRQLQSIHRTLAGEAALETMEEWIELRLKADGRGHIFVSGVLMDEAGMGNRLQFTLQSLDQTHLPPILDALGAIEDAFPTVGNPAR